MAKTPRDPDDREFADPADLFADEPRAPTLPQGSAPTAGGGYDLEEFEEPADLGPAVPPIPISTPAPKPRRPRPEPEPEPEPFDEDDRPTRRAATVSEAGAVDEVWSRGAEWGSTILVLAIAALAFLVLIYMTFSINHLGLWFLIILTCGVAWVLLAYPIFVTLERPIRMTPEQALKDYFGALSHRAPHYRRMWLLLSNAGRRPFGSYEVFHAQWKARLAEFRALAKGPRSFEFRVADFKSEKSGGKSAIDAKYTIAVVPLGGESPAPIASFRMEAGFVKGPDGMWYLDEGRLIETRSKGRARGEGTEFD